jgi:hypothetical protein
MQQYISEYLVGNASNRSLGAEELNTLEALLDSFCAPISWETKSDSQLASTLVPSSIERHVVQECSPSLLALRGSQVVPGAALEKLLYTYLFPPTLQTTLLGLYLLCNSKCMWLLSSGRHAIPFFQLNLLERAQLLQSWAQVLFFLFGLQYNGFFCLY